MNANIITINAVESMDTMGNITEQQAVEFVEFLEKELSAKYPNARITVDLNNWQGSSDLYVESALDDQGYELESDPELLVREFINQCWNHWAN